MIHVQEAPNKVIHDTTINNTLSLKRNSFVWPTTKVWPNLSKRKLMVSRGETHGYLHREKSKAVSYGERERKNREDSSFMRWSSFCEIGRASMGIITA